MNEAEFQAAVLELLAQLGERVDALQDGVAELQAVVVAIPTDYPDLSGIEIGIDEIRNALVRS